MAKLASDVFVYSSLSAKKFLNSQNGQRTSLTLVAAGQKIGFLFSGDRRRFHLSNRRIVSRRHLGEIDFLSIAAPKLMSDMYVYSSPYDKKID